MSKGKILFLVTEDWYFCSHRLPIARAAKKEGYEVVVATRVHTHGEFIEKEGFKLIPLKNFQRESINPIKAFLGFLELVAIYRCEKPDIVHHVALKPVLIGSFAAMLYRKAKVVNAVAGLGFIFSSERVKARLLRPLITTGLWLCMKKTSVIVQNPDDAKMLIENSLISADRVFLIRGSGVDLDKFKVLPEPESAVFTIGVVARMLWDKGIAEFIDAAKLLHESGEKFVALLAGYPDPANPNSIPVAKLEEWNTYPYIKCVGKIEDVREIWKDSHISVLPSYREGLPKSLLESAACGRAIVTTDVPGCREIVIDGETGILVPAKSVKELAEAILKLKNNLELRRKLARQVREKVERELSVKVVVKSTLELYDRLVK